jgi:hypothetical protein
MYMWQLVGHDTSEGALCSGIGDELAPIMRLIEEYLMKRTGFVGHVVEVVPRMSVFHLDAIHVATGREWLSFRDRNGGVYWEARYRPADDDGACRLAGGGDPGIAAN